MSQSVVLKGVMCAAMLLSWGCSAMQQVIMRDDTGYKVFDKGRWAKVHNYDIDPTLRKMDAGQLLKFLAAGCKIRASRYSNGDYILRAFVPGKGGGQGGFTVGFWIGKTLVHGAFHSVVIITAGAVSLVATPAVGAVVASTMESTMLPFVEATSNVIGLGCAIGLAVETGPV